MSRVALAHDYLTQRGGAERVVLSLARLFGSPPIYTSVYDRAGTFPEFAALDVRPSVLQRVHRNGASGRGLLPLYPLAWETRSITGYDLVISSSSGWAHGARTGGGLHVCYSYTPARWLYQPDRYFAAGGPVQGWRASAARTLLPALRQWDRRAARRPDAFIAMTESLGERIEATYGRAPVAIVPPPVDLGRIRPAPSPVDGPFYLVIARLLPYKNVDLVIRACARSGRRLVVVGTGPAEASLRALAVELGSDVTFMADIDEEVLNGLLQHCVALVQPGEEDFGMVVLEANAAGRPCVALGRGGARSTVLRGRTGVLFDSASSESLVGALDEVEATSWDGKALKAHAEFYSEQSFQRRFKAAVDSIAG